MEQGDHSTLYLVGTIILLVMLPVVALGAVIPIAMLPFFRGDCSATGVCYTGGGGGENIDDTGYFGTGYIFDVDAATASDLEKKLKGTGLEGLGNDIIAAAQKYHLNPAYIAAHAALESGWGTSQIAKDKKNLFGWGAKDSCPYECAKTFSSYKDCIMTVMGHVKKDYLTPGGTYYEGETLEAMNTHYASDKDWAQKIKNIMVDFYKAMGKEPNF